MKMQKTLLSLHLLLMVYSLTSILSKLASGEPFLSFHFCLYYAGIISLLGVYAVGWQQIIKRMPLALAFSNKAITVVWGLVWGVLFFGEQPTLGKLIGVLCVIGGIAILSKESEEAKDE